MNFAKRLSWFFKLEKKRYIIGILSLGFVSIFNLIPPKVIGNVVDSIGEKTLTSNELIVNLIYLIASAFIMYGLRYVWRICIFGAANNLARI